MIPRTLAFHSATNTDDHKYRPGAIEIGKLDNSTSAKTTHHSDNKNQQSGNYSHSRGLPAYNYGQYPRSGAFADSPNTRAGHWGPAPDELDCRADGGPFQIPHPHVRIPRFCCAHLMYIQCILMHMAISDEIVYIYVVIAMCLCSRSLV